MSPALGGVGQGRLNTNDNFPPKKIWAKPESKRAKRKRGVGKMNFCPPALPAEGGMGGKRWAGFNPQNPLDFAQNGFGFHPTNTTKVNIEFNFMLEKNEKTKNLKERIARLKGFL